MPCDNVRVSLQHENERTSEEAAHNSQNVMSFHLFRTETGLTANVKSRACATVRVGIIYFVFMRDSMALSIKRRRREIENDQYQADRLQRKILRQNLGNLARVKAARCA